MVVKNSDSHLAQLQNIGCVDAENAYLEMRGLRRGRWTVRAVRLEVKRRSADYRLGTTPTAVAIVNQGR